MQRSGLVTGNRLPSHPPGETTDERIKSTWRMLIEGLDGTAAREARQTLSDIRRTMTLLTNATLELAETVRQNTATTRELIAHLDLFRNRVPDSDAHPGAGRE